jgi:hypothetical protein
MRMIGCSSKSAWQWCTFMGVQACPFSAQHFDACTAHALSNFTLVIHYSTMACKITGRR